VWWVNYTTTHPADYHVSWAEFRDAFRAHYIPTGVMRKKHQEFMDLKQGGRSVHDYSKQFNHLAQYAPDQVDTDEKKDRFMIGLSTKLQGCMAPNTGGTFPEFVSNMMIVDDAICAHKETKKRKVVAAPSSSAPPIHLDPSASSSVRSSSGLPAHLSDSTSGQHLRLYLHLLL
jgi:hypothetical protein